MLGLGFRVSGVLGVWGFRGLGVFGVWGLGFRIYFLPAPAVPHADSRRSSVGSAPGVPRLFLGPHWELVFFSLSLWYADIYIYIYIHIYIHIYIYIGSGVVRYSELIASTWVCRLAPRLLAPYCQDLPVSKFGNDVGSVFETM